MNRHTKYLREIGVAMTDGTFALRRRLCLYCERSRWFLVSGDQSRSIRCLGCRATAISLASLARIQALPLDPSRSRVYELSYHGVVFNWLKRRFANFECSEFFGPGAGSHVDGIRNEDVQQLSFADAVFDLVSSTEVFEHVPDYQRGFREVRRVLRKDGWFVFTVPLYDTPATTQVCRLGPGGRLEWMAEPEYHDSRVSGVASVPVFWRHSSVQIARDLLAAGFATAEVTLSSDFDGAVPQRVVVARC